MVLVPPSELPQALEIARIALGGSPPHPVTDGGVLSSLTADAIIRHRLSKLAVGHLGAMKLSSADSQRVTEDARLHTYAAFVLVRQTVPLANLIANAGMRFLIMKGVALAAETGSPVSRGAGDIDVVVDPGDMPLLHSALLDGGLRPVLALPAVTSRRARRVWQFLDREASYVGEDAHVDVHWRISPQRHLFPPFSALYARHTTVAIQGSDIPTLSPPDALAAACFHAYFDQFQPVRALVDVAMLIQLVDPASLPDDYSTPLKKMMAGVIALVGELFPGFATDRIAALLAPLPAPAAIVRRRFDRALASPRSPWEQSQDVGALWSKLVSEAHFDHPLEVLPRFIGKRLFQFPPWNKNTPSTPLAVALRRRWRAERARRRSSRRRTTRMSA